MLEDSLLHIPKTNNEKSAEELINKLGMVAPNCYRCVFQGKLNPPHEFYRTCDSPVAKGIKFIGTQLRQAMGSTTEPLFPLVVLDGVTDDGSQVVEQIPGLIGLEYGISIGLCAWPNSFDPLYILWCIYYTTKEDVDTEKSPIDKA